MCSSSTTSPSCGRLRDDRFAVQVVKHDHQPTEATKFLGHQQTVYGKKNWSSVMLFNNARCRALTPEFVNTATGLQLHQFKWLDSDDAIGELPPEWNHLVDYDNARPAAELANLHYTHGGPWFADSRGCGYAGLWWNELEDALRPLPEQGWPTLPVPVAAREAA